MPQRVPISPQERMNFCWTGLSFVIFVCFCLNRQYQNVCWRQRFSSAMNRSQPSRMAREGIALAGGRIALKRRDGCERERLGEGDAPLCAANDRESERVDCEFQFRLGTIDGRGSFALLRQQMGGGRLDSVACAGVALTHGGGRAESRYHRHRD